MKKKSIACLSFLLLVSSFSRPYDFSANPTVNGGCVGFAAALILAGTIAFRESIFGNSKPMDGADFEEEAKVLVKDVESGTKDLKRRGCVKRCRGLRRKYTEIKDRVLDLHHEAKKVKLTEEEEQQEREESKRSSEEDPEGEQTE